MPKFSFEINDTGRSKPPPKPALPRYVTWFLFVAVFITAFALVWTYF
jgi:hypothetical protein